MRKFYIAAFAGLMISLCTSAQTREVGFKSHSGTNSNFRVAIENEFFDASHSDFGVSPQRSITTAVLDSVIYISDSLAIMVTSEHCSIAYRKSTTVSDQYKGIWSRGRLLVPNHPLFSKRHSLDSIRKVIKQEYYFQNPVDSVVFVGYDNNLPKDCNTNPGQYQSIPVAINNDDDQNPFGPTFLIMILSIIILSLAGGVIAWYKTQRRKTNLLPA